MSTIWWPAFLEAASKNPTAEMLQSCCTEAAEGGNVDNGFTIESLAKPRETKKASCEAL